MCLLNDEGVLYYKTCSKCGEPITADGGRYNAVKYVTIDCDTICEDCWSEFCEEFWDANYTKDRIIYGDVVKRINTGGRFY